MASLTQPRSPLSEPLGRRSRATYTAFCALGESSLISAFEFGPSPVVAAVIIRVVPIVVRIFTHIDTGLLAVIRLTELLVLASAVGFTWRIIRATT